MVNQMIQEHTEENRLYIFIPDLQHLQLSVVVV